jgi:hypothetical protein
VGRTHDDELDVTSRDVAIDVGAGGRSGGAGAANGGRRGAAPMPAVVIDDEDEDGDLGRGTEGARRL